MKQLIMAYAKKIPADIRKKILEERFIDIASPTVDIKDTPMEYLFDVYNEFVDETKEFSNWYCPKCRDHVFVQFCKMKVPLMLLEQQANGV